MVRIGVVPKLMMMMISIRAIMVGGMKSEVMMMISIDSNYVSPRQGRETYCFSPCVCLSVTNRVRCIT